MDVTFVVPPWSLDEQYGLKLSKVGSIEEPLGLAYIAAVLEEAGHKVRIMDCIAEKIDQNTFRKEIEKSGTDFVGITALTPMISKTYDAVRIINEACPDIPVSIGGPHVGAMININRHEQIFENNCHIDIAIYGEGEYTMLDIVERMKKGKSIEDVEGTIVNKDGRIILNEPRKAIEHLDELPFPARHLLPEGVYIPTPSSYKKLPVKSMISSRGCPFQCIFCDKSVFGSKVRFRSPENVVDEMELLVDKYKANEIRFWDDNFTLKEDQVEKICNEIKNRGVDVIWSCFGRVNTVNAEMLKNMKRSGCWQIDYGVESGNNDVLRFIKKGFTKEQVVNTFRLTREAGINIRAFFILGLPTETVDTVKETIEFSKVCDPDMAVFYLPQAYPGTELFEIAIKENALRTKDWSRYLIAADEPTYTNSNIGVEKIQELHRKAFREFYLRPKTILRFFIKMRSISDINRYIRGFLTVNRI